MKRYIVRIVGPSGMERYLCRGREVERDNATHYSSPSAAREAISGYMTRWDRPPNVILNVIDLRDPERQA